jgi:hypothetical protein
MTSPMARLQQKKQAAVTTGSAGSTGIPCAMVYGLYRDLLGDRAFLPPSSLRSLLLKNLTSASGGRDHATSPSAKGHVRLTCHPRPSHPRPTCRDDRAYVPLHRGRMRERIVLICPTPQARTHAADWHDGQFAHGVHWELPVGWRVSGRNLTLRGRQFVWRAAHDTYRYPGFQLTCCLASNIGFLPACLYAKHSLCACSLGRHQLDWFTRSNGHLNSSPA